MQDEEFRRIMRSLTNKRTNKIDVALVKLIEADVKADLVATIVKYGAPILNDLIGPKTDPATLSTAGYTETYTSKGFSFVGTPAHFNRFADKSSRKAKMSG